MARAPEPTDGPLDALLLGWLAFHRDALAAKCAGLDDDALVRRSAAPSALSLLGLVRHLTEMERHYLVGALSGSPVPLLYCTEESPDGDVDDLTPTMVGESMAQWHEHRVLADRLLAENADLAAPVPGGSRSVGWHVAKVVQEYARHNGHADLLRERIDGAVGE
ncbi:MULTISPECIES: DinB family protein [Cellulomonas]|uniref:Mini-circle protein n=1 Tax=Cellulomonas iranensis TaxID=76862 RepID=A0ABU0GF42_9CELL|nr:MULTISPECIES: DinB family protein [Cellulomonas]MDQ0423975.1 hypothetical protein [Cellulomonas iranensis]TFH72788.1 DinB family protein [Cellulomonas sp. HD19AZ1]